MTKNVKFVVTFDLEVGDPHANYVFKLNTANEIKMADVNKPFPSCYMPPDESEAWELKLIFI